MNDNVLYHSLSESGSNLTDLRQIEIPSSRHSSTLLAHCMSGQAGFPLFRGWPTDRPSVESTPLGDSGIED